MAEKMPAFQFYPGDWRKDPGIQSLGYEARGIWHELLCFMHESEQRGRLVFPDGSPMNDDAIAQMLGISLEKWKQTRKQIVSRRVASIDENGVIYNRRICREEAIRQAKIEAGRKGGRAKQTPSKTPSKTQAKGGSSSSSSSSKHTPLPPASGGTENGEEKPARQGLRSEGNSPRQLSALEKLREEEEAKDDAQIQRQVDDAWVEANAAPPDVALDAVEKMKALAGAGKTAPPDEPPTITEDDIPW